MIWQPIDTAPRDGTKILGCEAHDGEPYLQVIEWGQFGWVFADGEYGMFPTHWMPIPEPPNVV